MKQMKNRLSGTMIAIILATFSLTAQPDSVKIFVAGECGMCKDRIEKAAGAVEGVTGATWNTETKTLRVSFGDKTGDITNIHKAVAAVGHDTKLVKADDAVYDKLPACCKYERVKYDEKKKK